MIKKLILLLFITLSKTLTAQSKTSLIIKAKEINEEKIYVHVNNNSLITGETIYYSVYCLDNDNLSYLSKIAYIELINSDNKSITKQRISLTKGIGNGDMFIDTKVKTGSYKLIAYTQWMKNKNSFFHEDIFIINPFSYKLIQKKDTSIQNINTEKTDKKNDENIFFSNLKKTYSKREKINLSPINNYKHFRGNFSISIKKKDNFSFPRKTAIKKTEKTNNNFYLPELRGAIIKGYVKTLNNKISKSNIKLSLSIKDKDELPISSITNEKGEFYFNFPYSNIEKVYIQVLEDNPSNYQIELIKQPKSFFEIHNFQKLKLNDKIISTVKNRCIYSQVENAYYVIKKDSLQNNTYKNLLFKNNQITYKLDDYKRFKTIKETFTEIINDAYLIKSKNQYRIIVNSERNSKSTKHLPSLLIVDGIIINNHDTFVDFNSEKINSISIIKDKYFYGNALYQGVVLIKTFQNDFFLESNNLKEFKILPIQPEKKYFFQNNSNIKNKRIPDFRTQLFWNPSIDSTKNRVTFYTSDITGEFEIILQGYSEKGEFVNFKQTFSVK